MKTIAKLVLLATIMVGAQSYAQSTVNPIASPKKTASVDCGASKNASNKTCKSKSAKKINHSYNHLSEEVRHI